MLYRPISTGENKMRRSVLIAASAALAFSAPARADTAAEIESIEQAWGQAFLKNDKAYLERLLAPEFKLMRAEGGASTFTPRAQWLANYDHYIFHMFEVRMVDVVAAGDTAVATVHGRWKIGMKGRDGSREEGFVLSDTFVKRDGQWWAVYRHSTPSPAPAAAPAPALSPAPADQPASN
jgi:ketosteroid isomerase-like protein